MCQCVQDAILSKLPCLCQARMGPSSIFASCSNSTTSVWSSTIVETVSQVQPSPCKCLGVSSPCINTSSDQTIESESTQLPMERCVLVESPVESWRIGVSSCLICLLPISLVCSFFRSLQRLESCILTHMSRFRLRDLLRWRSRPIKLDTHRYSQKVGHQEKIFSLKFSL